MNIRYELMYQYICHQEEKEKNKLLQDLEKTGDRLDIQAKLFLLDVIFMKFRFMQQEDNEKTNFFVQYVCDGDTLLTTEYSGEFSCYEYSPAEIETNVSQPTTLHLLLVSSPIATAVPSFCKPRE